MWPDYFLLHYYLVHLHPFCFYSPRSCPNPSFFASKTWIALWFRVLFASFFLAFSDLYFADCIGSKIFAFIDVEKRGTITFRQVILLICLISLVSRWLKVPYGFNMWLLTTSFNMHPSNMLVCCFQFLYGSAHVLKQPLFRQACELAYAECGSAIKDYIVEQDVLCSYLSCYLPLFCWTNSDLISYSI